MTFNLFYPYGVPGQVNNMEHKRAFVRNSYTKRPALENEKQNITITAKPSDCMELRTKSNERLEFLGDGVLESILNITCRRFPKK